MGNILLESQYYLIAINMPYVVPSDPGPPSVITIGLTEVKLGNLLRAHRKVLRERKEWLNIEREVKKQIQEAFPPGEISGMQDLHHGFKNT